MRIFRSLFGYKKKSSLELPSEIGKNLRIKQLTSVESGESWCLLSHDEELTVLFGGGNGPQFDAFAITSKSRQEKCR